MRIQHNIMAMNAYRNLTNNNSALSKNLEKLSSGYKINRAGDDAAGLAISEKMRAQITGLEVAQKNAKDGISLVQTAEGALTEVHDMLNRMYELAEQSANGTYDQTDRDQLQKEIDALKNEINRIADSANFNGIDLLNGELAKAAGIDIGDFTSADVAAVLSDVIGTIADPAKTVDGVLSAGKEEVKYSASVYVGDITNNNAGDKTFKFSYKDNGGNTKDITLTIEAEKTATVEDIFNALTTGSASGGIKAVNDAGSGATGAFKDLYDVTLNGNILQVTAKEHGTAFDTASKIDGSKLGVTGIANGDLDATDWTAAQEALEEKFDGVTNNPISFGSVGQETDYVAAVKGKYQVASIEVALTGPTGKDMHNQAITVGDTLYIIKSGTAELKGVPEDKNVKVIEVEDTDTAADVGDKLAAAITADEPNNGGYIASSDGTGNITISESTNRGQKILDGEAGYVPGKGANLAGFTQLELTAGQSTISGSITFDGTLSNGSTVTIGDKTYMLTSDPSMNASGGATKVVFQKGATPADTANNIAKALADQLTNDGITGVTASGGVITFNNSVVSGSGISSTGSGLTLQIGDTADSWNQLNVVIEDMHTDSMGIADVDISKQDSAIDAMANVKDAINYVSSARGTLGATQNRLDHTINNLSVMAENIQDAEATIRDTDVAEEMMAYTKNNILIQSAQAMLAQANQVPQGVLQLLG